MADDVLMAKVATIERCLVWIRQDFGDDPKRLDDRVTEHAIILNVQRACQAAIDMAMHLVAREGLGLPQESREAFTLLEQAGTLDGALAQSLRGMVGFRNVAIHEYQKLSRAILESILATGLTDLERFCGAVVRAG